MSILLFSDIAAEEPHERLGDRGRDRGRERADQTRPPYLHTSPSLVDLDVLDREKKELFRSFLPPRFVFTVHGSAKEWSLGCDNSRPAARGSQETGFTQPMDHSFA